MRGWKRLFYYLVINVLVSACTVLVALSMWERYLSPRFGAGALDLEATTQSPSSLSTSLTADLIPSPATTATRSLIVYQVVAGDTLGDIAEKYGVSVKELMELNGLSDPNALGTGMVLFIPLSPEAILTATALVEPTEVASTTPQTQTVQGPELAIANVFGVGDLETERVRLECHGEGEISLEGWHLQDEGGNVYTFPQLTLLPGGSVAVYTKKGRNEVRALYWGLDQPVWSTGELVTLLDNFGKVRATYRVP